jgi:hypothetical protein
MTMRTSLTLALAFVLAAAAGGCVVDSGSSNATITVRNDSSHILTEVRVAPVNQVSWGPNLLPDVLNPGEDLTVSVRCDTYDVLVTDDRDRMCVLGDLDLCFSDNVWSIDNATLHSCGF